MGLAIVAALVLKALVLQAFYIPSGSMENTLLVNDRIVVNKLAYKFGPPDRGDIVVFSSPPKEREENPDIDNLVKRVIGVPGDTIFASDGDLFVNGELQDEPYVLGDTIFDGPVDGCPQSLTLPDFDSCVVPEGTFFLMGDNREFSQDGRFFGPVPKDLLVGKAVAKVWPLQDFTVF